MAKFLKWALVVVTALIMPVGIVTSVLAFVNGVVVAGFSNLLTTLVCLFGFLLVVNINISRKDDKDVEEHDEN